MVDQIQTQSDQNNVGAFHSMSMKHETELRKRFERLTSLGKQVEATSKLIDINVRPNYLNEKRFKRAQKVIQKYYANVSLASSTGLILLVQLKNILIPLLKTGKSGSVCKLYDRYVSTANYVRHYYYSEFYDQSSEGWKYVQVVRAMHQRIHQLMQEDPEAVELKQTADPNAVWVNQYDMALTQFAFIGLFLLKPKKCGAYHTTKQELEDVTYFWHLLSYYFGIEEQFNIFVYDEDLDKQLEYMNLILEHKKELLLSSRDKSIGQPMAEGITLAFEDFNKESSFNILDHWWHPYVSLSGTELKPYTLKDKFKNKLFRFYFKVVFRNDTLRWLASESYRKKFDKLLRKTEKDKRKLAKKYGHIKYER